MAAAKGAELTPKLWPQQMQKITLTKHTATLYTEVLCFSAEGRCAAAQVLSPAFRADAFGGGVVSKRGGTHTVRRRFINATNTLTQQTTTRMGVATHRVVLSCHPQSNVQSVRTAPPADTHTLTKANLHKKGQQRDTAGCWCGMWMAVFDGRRTCKHTLVQHSAPIVSLPCARLCFHFSVCRQKKGAIQKACTFGKMNIMVMWKRERQCAFV